MECTVPPQPAASVAPTMSSGRQSPPLTSTFGFELEYERERRVLLEPRHEARRFQRRGDGKPILERVHRPLCTFAEALHGRV